MPGPALLGDNPAGLAALVQFAVLPAKFARWAIVDAAHDEVFGTVEVAVPINEADATFL
jgi:hypothetical protein